ncbi:MAG: DUF4364 family protein [Clostridia bacterium]|nr:DUF4364 family protein [Clostridia bacterium]
MGFDTFREDVNPGGLYSADEVKILICYILKKANVPLKNENICNIIMKDKLANYFNIVQALSDLLASENIEKDGEKYFSLTDKGKVIAEQLSSQLPFTVRERAEKAASKEVLMAKRTKENNIVIDPRENGGYTVSIAMKDGANEFMTFSLQVGSLEEANMAKERFLENPTEFYLTNIKMLLGYEHKNEA